jgi:hypothetical protein
MADIGAKCDTHTHTERERERERELIGWIGIM